MRKKEKLKNKKQKEKSSIRFSLKDISAERAGGVIAALEPFILRGGNSHEHSGFREGREGGGEGMAYQAAAMKLVLAGLAGDLWK